MENDRRKYAKKTVNPNRYGDPVVDLVMALILHAVREAKAGDRDAAQFLVAHNGAELWLKCVGIGVTNQMRRKLELLAIGAE